MININKVLVCGSISYDTIMNFNGRFEEHIFPENINILNLAFNVATLRREFGGCAANICYNMSLIGCNGLPVATVGNDFENYKQWMLRNNLCLNHIRVIDEHCSAQDYITTDLNNNQLATFHPGAMDYAHENSIEDFSDVVMGVISPDGLEGMHFHAKQFSQAEIPFLLDTGQVTPLLSGNELLTLIHQSEWAIFNAYEWKVFQEKTNLDHQTISTMITAHIVTNGSKGSTIYLKDSTIQIPAAKTKEHNDPTGCGDAYRAGLIFGLINSLDLETSGKIGSVMGAFSFESAGSQNHSFNQSQFYQRYSENFGSNLHLKKLLEL